MRGLANTALWATRAVALRAALPLMVSRATLPELLRRLDSGRPAPGGSEDPEALLRLTARLSSPLRFWRTTCLYRALAAYAVLRAAGHPVRFLIGVRVTEDGDVEAHAWLEREGKPSLGAPAPEDGFKVAYAWPVRGAEGWPREEREMQTLRPSSDAVLTEMQDGTGVLLQLETRFYYTLNRTGVRLWKLLEQGGAADEVAAAEALSQEFRAADPAQVRRDVAALLREFIAEKLVVGA